MDIRSKALLTLFRNNNYFIDLHEYLKERVKENKLDYKSLLYIYNKLYLGRTLYVKQNIYPVAEFLSKGYSIDELALISNLLPDACKYTIFSEEKDKGYVYNKIFSDLEWSFENYNEYIKEDNISKEEAFVLTKKEIELTNVKQREVEILMKNHPDELFTNTKYLWKGNDLVDYYMELVNDKKKIEQEFTKRYKENINEYNTEKTNVEDEKEKLVHRYKRLNITIDKANNLLSKEKFLNAIESLTEEQYYEKLKDFYIIQLKQCKDINDERIDEIIDEAFENEDLGNEEFEHLIYSFRKVFNEKFNLNIPEYDEIEKQSAYEIIISHKYSYYEQNEQEENEDEVEV